MRFVKQAQQEARDLKCKLFIGVLAFDDSARVLFFRSADDPDLLANLEACLGPLRPDGLTSFAAAAQGWMDYMKKPEVIGLLNGATPTVELHYVITDGRDSSSPLPKWEASDTTLRQCVFVVTTVYGDPLSAARFAQYAPDGSQVITAKEPAALEVPVSLGLGASKPFLHVNIHDERGVGHPEVTGTFLFSARSGGVGQPISFGSPIDRDGQKAVFAWRANAPEGSELYIFTDRCSVELERPGHAPLTIELQDQGPEGDLDVVKEFLTLPCGLAHSSNQKYQRRLKQSLSIRYQKPAGSLTRGFNPVKLDPETATVAREVPTPTGHGAKLQVSSVTVHEEQVLVELLGGSKPERDEYRGGPRPRARGPEAVHRGGPLPMSRGGRPRAFRGGANPDQEVVVKPVKRKKDVDGSNSNATRQEVWKEYLSPCTEYIPFLCALPEKLARARKDLGSILACKEYAETAGQLGLAKLLGDAGQSFERVIDAHARRYNSLTSRLFVGDELNLLRLCKTPPQKFSGVDYDPGQPFAANVQKVAERFPLPGNYMSITEDEAEDLLKEKASTRAGTVLVLQATSSDKDPSALVFRTIQGREICQIRVNWGVTFAKRLFEEVYAEARRALPGDWLSVSIVKSDHSRLDQDQIMPLMPEEFHRAG
jgi:hypothetical protein